MKVICGIDEAGRGPLAGPVVAAAVILNNDFPVEILNDSKKISHTKRLEISSIIRHKASFYSTGWVWPEEIDKLNIHNATLLAMKRAYENLENIADLVLVDGKFTPSINSEKEAVIKGDSKIHEIMAASIIAKTSRDMWMIRYSWIDSRYEFEKHKGYPTKRHRQLIAEYGPSFIQRKSFTFSYP